MKRKGMFVPLLVAFVAGCAADAPPPANALAAESPASMQATAAAPAATVATRKTEAGSLCAPAETVLFSCEAKAGKWASLCASRDVGAGHGYLYYAYGAPGHPELVFPSEKRPPTDFKRTQLAFAGSTGGYAYSFENAGYRYIAYSVSGAENLEEQGVLITHGNARSAISALPCRKGSAVEDDDPALLDLTFTWPADPDLDQHGLPKSN
jgi:hypothetical protein